MERTTTYIPPADHQLFLRCRELHEAIRQAKSDLDVLTASPLYRLRGLMDEELPEDMRSKILCTQMRIDKETERMNAASAELDVLSCEAEKAAQSIRSDGLRRFVRLYCIDGLPYSEAVNGCGVCARSGCRYAALLRRQPTE